MPETTLPNAPADADRSFRAACAEIDRRVRAGESHVAETWAGSFADDHDRLVELIFTEFATRQAHGQTPQPGDYYDRFPTLADRLRRMFEVDELLRHDDARPPDEETPTVGPYELKERLGSGGMGVVYRGWHPVLKRNVAIKLLAPLAGEGSHDRFLREARSIASLNHPNVIQLFDVGEQDQQPYMVMEYAAGGSLRERIAGHLLPPREAADLVETLAHAVAYAHARGILHRDLKPGNILLVPDEGVDPLTAPYVSLRAKIGDFGLATSIDKSTNSLSGTAVGTPSYMAPEQAEGRLPPSPAVDVYALGAVLYECLVGRPPFLGDSAAETLLKLGRDEPVPPRQLRREVPADLETICLKCLAKSPGRRYASATALAEDLRRFLNGQPIAARPIGRGERLVKFAKRRPIVTLAIAATGLALLAGLVGWAEFTRRLGDESRATRQQRDRADHARDLAIAGRVQAETERERVSKLLDANREYQYVARILKAESLRVSDPVKARETLHSTEWCPPERRDFLWNVLDRACQARTWQATPPTGGVNAMALSGDRRLVVVGGRDGGVFGLDPATGAEVFSRPKAHAAAVSAVAVSADGKRIFSASVDGVVRVWSPGPPGIDRIVSTERRPVYALAFADGTDTLYVGGGRRADGGLAAAYDASSGDPRPGPAAPARVVRSLLASPDGGSLWMGLDGGEVFHWQPGGIKGRFGVPWLRANHLARRADGLLCVAGAMPNHARLVDAGGRMLRDTPPSRLVWGSDFSPDGRFVALAEAGNHVAVVRVEDGQLVTTFRGHAPPRPPDKRTYPIFDETLLGSDAASQSVAVAFIDDRRLVAASADGTVGGWTLETEPRPIPGPDGPPLTTSVVGDPHADIAWSVGSDRRLHVVDLATGRIEPTGDPLPHSVIELAAGERWLVGRGNGVRKPNPATPVVAWRRSDLADRDAITVPDLLASIAEGADGAVWLLTARGELLEWTPFSGKPPTARWTHPNGRCVVARVDGGMVTVSAGSAVRWPEGVPMRATFPQAPKRTQESPDGRTLAVWVGSDDPTRDRLFLWDAAGDGLPREVEFGRGVVLRAAFSPDGRTLAAVGSDRRLRLVNVATGEVLSMFPTADDLTNGRGLSFTADGLSLRLVQSHGPKAATRVLRWGPS